MLMMICSGVRFLSKSAIRPTATRRAFEPLRKQAIPALSTRFASTEATAKDGKIHQVIGAVVDGTRNPLSYRWSFG